MPETKSLRTTLATLGLLALSAAVFTGCQSNEEEDELTRLREELEAETIGPDDVSTWDIAMDPTPELRSETGRWEDLGMAFSRRVNNDVRSFWDDLYRAMYWDRPSRLTPRPMP